MHAKILPLAVLSAACHPSAPEYHADVAPILARHCLECHRHDGVAPAPPMDTYVNVRRYARQIARAVADRDMPPWAVDNTGLCGQWHGAHWLDSREIATVVRWVEEGAREGKPAVAPPPTSPLADAPFRSDAVLDIGGMYQPGRGAGEYRCFVTDPRLVTDRLLTALRVSPSDPRGLQELTMFALDSDAAERSVAALDGADPGMGYSCLGTPLTPDVRPVASWTAADPILRLPAGVGVRLHGGHKIVLQTRFNFWGPASEYRSSLRVDLELDDSAREATVRSLAASVELPPGQAYVATTARHTIERKTELVAVTPTMHARGTSMRLQLEHAGQTSCLALFNHWKFGRRQLFELATPVELEPTDAIRISCAYSTLGATEPVRRGDTITDEECVASLLVLEK